MISFAHLCCPARSHLVPARHGWFAVMLIDGVIVAEGWSDDPWHAAARAVGAWRGKR